MGLAVLAKPAQAVPITGHLDLNGGTGVGVTIGATTIDWDPSGGGTGTFQVTGGTGSFAGAYLTPSGTVKDLNTGIAPVGTPFLLSNYMTFADPTHSNIVFDLRFINTGIFSSAACILPAAAGQVCSEGPFNMVNDTASSSHVSLDVSGTVRNLLDSTVLSVFTGIYTTQFDTMNFQQILAALDTGGTVHSSYSGSFAVDVAPAIPEPASLFLLGSGLVGMATRYRKRRGAGSV